GEGSATSRSWRTYGSPNRSKTTAFMGKGLQWRGAYRPAPPAFPPFGAPPGRHPEEPTRRSRGQRRICFRRAGGLVRLPSARRRSFASLRMTGPSWRAHIGVRLHLTLVEGVHLRVEVGEVAVVFDHEVGEATEGLGGELVPHPLEHLLAADAVARGHPREAHLQRRVHDGDGVEV